MTEAPMPQLPVAAIAEEVNASLEACPRLVVTAPPGSGKSTLLPLTIARHFTGGKVVMLEPRKAATRQIAMRLARTLGEEPGATVGYRMRFDTRVSAATRIEVVTEGVMERMLIDDPTLSGIDVVIFDEFHERSLIADLSLALTLEAQQVLRPDLRVVVMSATIDTTALCEALDAPCITAEGKMFDVAIFHSTDDTDLRDCSAAVTSAVRRAWREQHGHILAFLPGQAEISRCAEALASALPEAVVLPLHGMLPASEQYHAIEYNPGERRRKIVLATPVAETSLTIEGITTVVDSGLCRRMKYDTGTGLGRLETVRISLDMARQRAGRAGRLASGVCYRLWTVATEHRMSAARTPEICDADLCAMVLAVAAWGSADPTQLPWLTPPPRTHIEQARELLTMLGAIDGRGIITPHGKRMAALPCHPRIAHMLLTASDAPRRALAADIAALLEEKDPVNDERDADINTRITMLRHQRSHGATGAWRRIERIAAQYRAMVHTHEYNTSPNFYDTGMLLASAYPERIAMKMGHGVYRLASGDDVQLPETDDLSACDFLAVASMGRRIFLASPITTATLESMAQPRRTMAWNSREGRVNAREELRIGALTISSRPTPNPDRAAMNQAISRAAVKEGLSMFDFSDAVEALQQRIATVAEWHPELELPDISTPHLLETAGEWLPLYIGDATTRQELRKIDLCNVIEGLVGYALMASVNEIAPTHVKLPGGRNARILYRPGAPAPVVSARLQDCLGLYETPRLDHGTRPVLMELLSPGFKPVQLTQDLHGFWSNTYFEVRKELRRRYPKHRWPENPLDYSAD
jgi:ATP-dependent helicase hrpB